ncbi:MAG: hypothetical protein ACXQT2_04485 [Methanotrichaceae archaeon]
MRDVPEAVGDEPKCLDCEHGELVHVGDAEYYVCYRKRPPKLVKGRMECPWFKPK